MFDWSPVTVTDEAAIIQGAASYPDRTYNGHGLRCRTAGRSLFQTVTGFSAVRRA
jgi:hypothetical protein